MSQFHEIPKVNVLGRISGFSRIFPDLSGFFISCSNFDLKKINFLFLYIFKNFIFIGIFYFYFWLFLLNSVQKKLSQFHEIPKVNVLGRISGFSRIFPDLSGFFISCSNFDLKKINFLFLYIFKNFIFIGIFYFYFWLFLLNSVQKKLSQFHEIPKVNVLEPAFSYLHFLRKRMVWPFRFSSHHGSGMYRFSSDCFLAICHGCGVTGEQSVL